MTLCLCLFAAACSDDNDDDNGKVDKSRFKVTVLLPDNSPAVGVSVGICSMDGTHKQCLQPVSTDSNGVASIDISDYGDTTEYLVHVSNLPDGYAYVDENGTPYNPDDQMAGARVKVSNGYSYTVKLKATTQSPTISVELANTSATQEVEPAISIAGFYELVSVTPFTVAGEGYSLTDGYYSVTMYLEPGDTLKIGTTGNSRRFTIALVAAEATGATAETAFSTASNSAFVLKLNANQAVHFVNPETVNNREGSVLIIDGTNYKSSTDSNVLGLGVKFTVSTADEKAGTAIVIFHTPSTGTTVTVGESKQFDILLVNNGGKMTWVGDSQEGRISFSANTSGTYRVTVTSSYENDMISILKAEYYNEDLVVHSLDPKSSDTAGKSYSATFDIEVDAGATLNVNVSFTNTDSAISDKFDYTDAHTDKITYTVLVELVTE